MKQLIILMSIILSITSCDNKIEVQNKGNSKPIKTGGLSGGSAGTLPNANGKHGQILVAIDNDLWKGDIESIFEEKFKDTAVGPYIYLEYVFDYNQINIKEVNSIRKKNRNFLTKFWIMTKNITKRKC